MPKEEFISTGIEKLDKLLEGGTPKGYTVLILGTPGSSIEILSKQLATTGKVLYFTTEESEDEVKDAMHILSVFADEIVSVAENKKESLTNRVGVALLCHKIYDLYWELEQKYEYGELHELLGEELEK